MPHTDKTIAKHPFLNPNWNWRGYRGNIIVRMKPKPGQKVGVAVPVSCGRYMPHYGEKERAKYKTSAPHRLGGS